MIPRQRIWDPIGSPAHDLLQQTLHQAFCRHLVCLTIDFERVVPKGDAHDSFDIVCSGFIVLVGDRWVLVTAGHFVEDVHNRINSGEFQEPQCRLSSFFGPKAQQGLSTPFPFYTLHQVYTNVPGLDVAFIFLDNLYQEWLKSDEILPIQAGQMAEPEKFNNFFLLGFPREVVDRTKKKGFAPVIMSLDQLDELPDGVAVDEPEAPRFIGKINVPIDFDISGMSGGPIFAIKLTSEKTIRYWLVASQSSWFSRKKVILGTSAEAISAQLLSYLADKDPDNPFFDDLKLPD